jgi:alginate O-acetyltransferase complex protein AlgI
MLVVMFAWVFFRVEGLQNAIAFIDVLLGKAGGGAAAQPYSAAQGLHIGALMLVAVILAAGAYAAACSAGWAADWRSRTRTLALDGFLRSLVVLPMLALSMMMLALGQYNPFIYFRF